MIYTIGKTDVYEISFAKATEEHPPKKVGSNPDSGYKGGTVWQTENEALRAANQQPGDYSVYGVLADWEEDVQNGHLTRDAELVKTV